MSSSSPDALAGGASIDLPTDVPVDASVDDRRARELLGCALWAVAALAWTLAMLVPWFRAGAWSHVSPIEVGGALRTGMLGIPAVAGFGVLLLPLASWVLLATAPARGRGALVLRLGWWGLSTATSVTLLLVMASVSAGTYGAGAALVVAACLLGAGALCCSTVRAAAGAGTAAGTAVGTAAGTD